MKIIDAAIIGAGASGLFAAAHLQGLNVALFEAASEPGRKLAASGGGYANFANSETGLQFYVCEKDFCEGPLCRFTLTLLTDFLALHGLAWERRSGGRYFLKTPASGLVRVLTEAATLPGTRLFLDSRVISIEKSGAFFLLKTPSHSFCAKIVLLAAGSPACPALGGSPAGLELAKRLGHRIVPPAPALVPLLWAQEELAKFSCLAGISLPAQVAIPAHELRGRETNGKGMAIDGDVLFTHKGVSGPAILNISLYWRKGLPLCLDFLPGLSFEKMLDENEKGGRSPRSILKSFLPARLADCILPQKTAREPIARLSRAERRALGAIVNNFTFVPKGTAGMRMAEVSRGGVKTDDVDPRSMESLITPNLFLAGEILDVTGRLGGYNLAWAFASGFCAARAIRQKLRHNVI